MLTGVNPMTVRLPNRASGAWAQLRLRLMLAGGAIVFVALVTYADRGGFTDSQGHEIGLLESFYYSTVSVTTTGYGDIVPSTDRARLITTLLVTPARILFLIVLVGTTVELLVSRQREELRISSWRKKLKNHTIICGFGVKGRAALEALVAQGVDRDSVIAIDTSPAALEAAQELGIAAISGSGSSSETLRRAGVDNASTIVVSPHLDDAAVLITLTARQQNKTATIVASVREEENAPLLRQSGADAVIVSSGAAGRLLGLAAGSPASVNVLEDLLVMGRGIDLAERRVTAGEAGPRTSLDEDRPLVGVMRDGVLLPYSDPEAQTLQAGDRLVVVDVADPKDESPED